MSAHTQTPPRKIHTKTLPLGGLHTVRDKHGGLNKKRMRKHRRGRRY